MPIAPNFVFVVCQPGSAPFLKNEILRNHPKLRFAFSRPGLLTFKNEGNLPTGFSLASPFVRVWGNSIGRATNAQELFELVRASGPRPPLRLHVFERDPKDAEALGPRVAELGSRAARLSAELLSADQKIFHSSPVAAPGELVLDVVVAPASEPEEPWLVGWHAQRETQSPHPGGPQRILPPPEAPSRAWSKIEEALAFSRLDFRPAQTVVEVGSAPGGISWALLQRGLQVVGIDPGDMDARVLDYAGPAGNRFVHLKEPIGAIGRPDLPRRVEWIVSDMNLAPPVMLRYVSWLVQMLRPSLQGVVLTLKVNDDRIRAAMPKLLDQVRELGFGDPLAVQLPSNRSEVTVVASPHLRPPAAP